MVHAAGYQPEPPILHAENRAVVLAVRPLHCHVLFDLRSIDHVPTPALDCGSLRRTRGNDVKQCVSLSVPTLENTGSVCRAVAGGKPRTGQEAYSPKKRSSLARAAVEGLISPIASTK